MKKEKFTINGSIVNGGFITIGRCYVVDGPDGGLHLCTHLFSKNYYDEKWHVIYHDVFTEKVVTEFPVKSEAFTPPKLIAYLWKEGISYPGLWHSQKSDNKLFGHYIMFNGKFYYQDEPLFLETIAQIWKEYKEAILKYRLDEKQRAELIEEYNNESQEASYKLTKTEKKPKALSLTLKKHNL